MRLITYGSSTLPVNPGNITKIGLLELSIPSYFTQSKQTPFVPTNFLSTDTLYLGVIFVLCKLIN